MFDKLSNSSFNFNNILGAVQNIASKISPIFEEGMMRETAAVNFSTLLKKEGKDGKVFADELRGTDAAALYGTSTVNENAQAMLAYGVDSDTTMEVLSAIGDIAMGDKQKMSSLATAFSQMSALGKLQTQDWKQMVGAGFDPLKQMEEDLKLGREELDAMMAKGQITGDMVKQAFVNATQGSGQFAGALKNVMENTLQGKIAMVTGAIDDLKAKLYEIALPIVMKVLPVITDQLIPAFMNTIDFISPVFDLIADNLDTVGVFVGILGALAAVMGIVNAVMSANPVSLIVIGIAALITLIYKVIDAYDRWGASIALLMGPLGWIVNIVMTIKRYWDDIVNAFESDGIIGGLKRIGVCIMDMLLYPVQQLLGWVGELTGWEWAKSSKDFVEEYRKSIGAIDPVKNVASESESQSTDPMAQLTAAVNGKPGQGTADLANATGKGKESVASGGTRNTSINITLSNLVETIAFNGTLEENKDDMENKVVECLQRVLYSATSAV
ncbi:MAG: tape measure protein [Bacteroidales bacterium]|nr:tape measure protein [Bacteroidales bacterium]